MVLDDFQKYIARRIERHSNHAVSASGEDWAKLQSAY